MCTRGRCEVTNTTESSMGVYSNSCWHFHFLTMKYIISTYFCTATYCITSSFHKPLFFTNYYSIKARQLKKKKKSKLCFGSSSIHTQFIHVLHRHFAVLLSSFIIIYSVVIEKFCLMVSWMEYYFVPYMDGRGFLFSFFLFLIARQGKNSSIKSQNMLWSES